MSSVCRVPWRSEIILTLGKTMTARMMAGWKVGDKNRRDHGREKGRKAEGEESGLLLPSPSCGIAQQSIGGTKAVRRRVILQLSRPTLSTVTRPLSLAKLRLEQGSSARCHIGRATKLSGTAEPSFEPQRPGATDLIRRLPVWDSEWTDESRVGQCCYPTMRRQSKEVAFGWLRVTTGLEL